MEINFIWLDNFFGFRRIFFSNFIMSYFDFSFANYLVLLGSKIFKQFSSFL